MKIASAPLPQPGRSLTLRPNNPPPPTPEAPVNHEKATREATMQEFSTLLSSSRKGMVVGALALGGLAAGLGSMGGVVGGALGTTAGFALGTTSVIGGCVGLGYLGLSKAPKDFRAILLGFAGLLVGGVAGGVLGRYGGEALRQLATTQPALAGAAAGLISAAPLGVLVGGVVHARKNLKQHPDAYPNLLKAKTDGPEDSKK